MNTIIDRFNNVKSIISNNNVQIVAVSKTFSFEYISPLVDFGHIHFGENKVQEAHSKWSEIKKKNKKIQLHMIGKLQSNKVKVATTLFDYIHSLDNQKLADTLSKCENVINKKNKYFIQVNVGKEKQKSGIEPEILDDFFYYCSKQLKLNVIGLMAIPPADGNTDKHFKYLSEANQSLGLKELSIGMSSDFENAIKFKSTFVRIGTSIFGSRT